MTETSFDDSEVRDILRKRSDILATLAETPATKPALTDRLDVSRSTVDRAIDDLTDYELIKRDADRYRVTPVGEYLLRSYEAYVAETEQLCAAVPVMSIADERGVKIHKSLLTEGELRLADPRAPEGALESAIEKLQQAERLRVFSRVTKSSYINLLHTEIVERGLEVELILGAEGIESLVDLAEVTDKVGGLLTADRFSLYRTDADLPFTLYLMSGPTDSVGVTVHKNGGIVGAVTAETESAVSWGHDEFSSMMETATPVSGSELLGEDQ